MRLTNVFNLNEKKIKFYYVLKIENSFFQFLTPKTEQRS